MWVNKTLYQLVLDDNKRQAGEITAVRTANADLSAQHSASRIQKVKDDVTIDWMRHRINALEKERAQLLMKAAGIALPVPEIVPTRPGTMSGLPNFDTMPSFEDVGDEEAARLGVSHTDDGTLSFSKE